MSQRGITRCARIAYRQLCQRALLSIPTRNTVPFSVFDRSLCSAAPAPQVNNSAAEGDLPSSDAPIIGSICSPAPLRARLLRYVSFFYYVRLDAAALPQVREEVHSSLKALGARGRIFLASEGINAQLTLPLGREERLRHAKDTWAEGAFRGATLVIGDIIEEQGVPAEADEDAEAKGSSSTDDTPTPAFGPVDLVPFPKLDVRVRSRLVRDGLPTEIHEQLRLDDHGRGLDAEQWHRELEELRHASAAQERPGEGPLILDCRNWYEHEVGRFVGSVPLNTTTYKETWEQLDAIIAKRDQHLQQQQHSSSSSNAGSAVSSTTKPPTYIFCTGGIRCVKVGAYLRAKDPSADVRFLKGGIYEYANFIKRKQEQRRRDEAPVASEQSSTSTPTTQHSCSDSSPARRPFRSLFLGTNFVFDYRVRRGNQRVTEDVLSNCVHCGAPTDQHVNCRNKRCDALFLQCARCTEERDRTCSDGCKQVVEEMDRTGATRWAHISRPYGNVFRPRLSFKPSETQLNANAAATIGSNRPFSTMAGAAASSVRCPVLPCPHVESYCAAHSTPASSSALLESIIRSTHESMPTRANMLSEAVVGSLLRALALAAIANSEKPRLLELGTFTGYSTAWMLDCLMHLSSSTAGTVVSLEKDASLAAIARANLSAHPRFASLELLVAPAADSLATFSPTESFDFIYLDANKKGYPKYVETILQRGLLKPTGIMLVDNTLWRGQLVRSHPLDSHGTMPDFHFAESAPEGTDSMGRAMHAFNRDLCRDPRLVVCMLPIREGLTIVQHRR